MAILAAIMILFGGSHPPVQTTNDATQASAPFGAGGAGPRKGN
jgi:hypothetical protein